MLSGFCTILAVGAFAAGTPFYGINEDLVWQPETDLPKVITALTDCCAESIRLPIRWTVIEPEKDRWEFSRVDSVIQAVPPHVEILATLMSVPAWANGTTPGDVEGYFDAYPPKELEDWQRFVEKTVTRYKHRITHWEVWNEQNGIDFYRPMPDPAGYTRLLRSAYEAAKRADPRCRVVLGGLQMNGIIPNPWSPVKIPDFLEDLYKAGARPHFDICNVHPYVLPNEGAGYMMRLVRDTLALMDRYGDSDKPLWITEVGCGINERDTAEDQARLLEDTFRLARQEPRIQRVFWFLLRDTKESILGPEDTMGLVTHDFQPKPAFHAFVKAVKAVEPVDAAAPPPLTRVSAPMVPTSWLDRTVRRIPSPASTAI